MDALNQVCTPSDLYWLWLCCIPGLYWRQQKALLHFFKTPENIFHATADDFQLFHRAGLSWIEQVRKAANDRFLNKQLRYLHAKGISFCSLENPAFPPKLKEISDCPTGLFVNGFLPDQQMRCAAVVGARVCSTYGKMMAHALSAVLVEEGFGVVSGMAAGIDAKAGYGALEKGGLTWAVMGCGADICYPKENAGLYNKIQTQGGILSELPPRSEPLKFHFPLRNRIISGLCEFVIVVEARTKSGSLITADYALEQGRDVWVVPGRCDDPLSSGCNALISQGAEIIVNIEDFRTKLRERYQRYPVKEGKETSEQSSTPDFTTDPVMEKVYRVLGSMPKTVGDIIREVNSHDPDLQILSDTPDASDTHTLDILNKPDTADPAFQQVDERDVSIALTRLVLNGYAQEIGKGSYIIS